MAAETLTIQNVARTGAQLSLESVTTADGFRFLNDGQTILYIEEQNAGAVTLTFTPTLKVDGLTPAGRAVVVTASQNWFMGPWPQQQYNDSDGYLNVAITADEASAVAAISVR